MPNPRHEWSYNFETLSRLSGLPEVRIRKEVTIGELNVGHIRDAAIWLASHGTPDIRAEMARRLVPVVLGTKRRRSKQLQLVAQSYDVMLQMFKHDLATDKIRREKISKTKRSAAKRQS